MKAEQFLDLYACEVCLMYSFEQVLTDIVWIESGPAHDLHVQQKSQDSKIPHCLKCRGCTTTLCNADSKQKLLHSEFVHANGASRAWIFEAHVTSSNTTRSKPAGNQVEEAESLRTRMVRQSINSEMKTADSSMFF